MDTFSLKRAIERLRTGLFDPVAVDCLTMEKDRIDTIFSKGLQALEKGRAEPLGICGSYGQGKSHTLTYLNRSALSQGYATSVVSLDLREVPFHQFSVVYQSIMERLSLPDGKKFIVAWKTWAHKDSLELLHTMPHRFKLILTAMLHTTKRLDPKESSLKKYRDYQPKEYGYWLDKALMGHNISASQLKSICKYRDVKDYLEQPLICRGNDPYFQMIQSLGKVLKEMGYKGLLLFFDEAESITQGRLGSRIKSYHLLEQFFQTKGFVFPLFAFTDDFFDQVNRETYDDGKNMFPKNYAEAWQNIDVIRLSDFSSHEWNSLLDRLIQLYCAAYHIDPPKQVKPVLQSIIGNLEAQETRFKLKALVHRLDIEMQQVLLDT